MKMKLNIDKNAIKTFFIDHLEKVVFGVILLVAVIIVIGGVRGREPFDKSPANLTEIAARAKTQIENPRSLSLQVKDYQTLAKSEPVLEAPYVQTKPWSRPTHNLERPRGVPPVLPVEQLRVATGVGMFSILSPEAIAAQANPGGERRRVLPGGGREEQPEVNPANTGATLRGERWVALTGLVPVQKQSAAFSDAFRDCKRFPTDELAYVGYKVERLEVTSPADVKNPNWNDAKKVAKFNFVGPSSAPREWQQAGQDVIDPKYVDPALMFPLGPWMDGAWDKEVAHEPEIPFSLGGTATPNEPNPDAAVPTPSTNGEEDPFAKQAAEAAAAGDNRMPGMEGVPRRGPPGMPMERMMGRGGLEGRAPMGAASSLDPTVTYRLFRYFDFSAEPGKRYIYRVQLIPKNPNYGIKPVTCLENPALATKQYLANGKWSDPSPIVTIPNDTTTFAIAVKQPTKPTDPPIGSMLLAMWLQKTGQKVYNEFAIERGQVLNYPDVDVRAAAQGASAIDPTSSIEKTDLVSNVMVVDLAGGKKLPGKPPKTSPSDDKKDPVGKVLPGEERGGLSPGEILVMDASGTLSIRNELEDLVTVIGYKTQPETPGGGMERMGPRMPPGGRGMMMPPGGPRGMEDLFRGVPPGGRPRGR